MCVWVVACLCRVDVYMCIRTYVCKSMCTCLLTPLPLQDLLREAFQVILTYIQLCEKLPVFCYDAWPVAWTLVPP